MAYSCVGPGVVLGLDRQPGVGVTCSSAHRSQAMNDPWAWGLAFLLGVIVGHHFSTVCPW
jgi:hypothetical protein